MRRTPATALLLSLLVGGCTSAAKSDTASPAGGPDSGSNDSGTPGPTSGTLRVLTYNVAGLPDGISGAEGPLLERMPAIQALLSDYDLVGLQEDFDEAGHAALTEGTGHAEVRWFSATLDDSRVYGSGLSQLLPAATVDYGEEHYTLCNGITDGASDCLASKGFQTATLRLGGQELDVLNTHHEAGSGPEDEVARLSQVDQVLAAIERDSGGRALLMTGDFNLRYSDPEDEEPLARYDAAGLLRSCELIGCDEPDHIDQIRIRSSAGLALEVLEWERVEAFVSEGGVDLSDHPAISAVIGWEVVGAED
jgi:endonuclease/exonuclease/phosphatase family metal-dependent hydrolase